MPLPWLKIVIAGSSPSISNSTVTVMSAKGAFNNVPSVDMNKCAVWYGSDPPCL